VNYLRSVTPEHAVGVLASGPLAILWSQHKDGREEWEILPLWVAELVLFDLLPYQVSQAILYQRLPVHAPRGVARAWLRAHLTDYKLTPLIAR